MPTNPQKAVAALCTGVALVLTSASTAIAAADLVINVTDTRIQPGSCEENSPLVTGRIAIKNKGDDAAALKVTERFTRSLLAVYVPQNIDMIDKKSQRRKLDPFDQEGIAFEIGTGIVKRGRRFTSQPATDLDDDNDRGNDNQSDRERIRAIQTALDKIGFDPGTIDGITGRNTRRAIRAFQESIGETQNGNLVDDQVTRLFIKAGNGTSTTTTSGSFYGARGEVEVTIYAVVDPYNLVTESNEANNLEVFTFTVDCGQ